MNNLEILSEEKIISLKTNKNVVKEHIATNSDNSWLCDFFNEEKPFAQSKIKFEDFSLKFPDSDNLSKYDLENAIILHENLKLTNSQASNERLWISLCFGYFYDYMSKRWSMQKEKNLGEHWLWPYGQKRSLYYNGLARLYWWAHITHDQRLDDPYELTRFCFQDADMITQMNFRSYTNSPVIRLSIIKALKQFTEDGGEYSRTILREILKYVSFLGGAYILDSFSEQELFDKILAKLKSYNSENNFAL